MKRVVAFYLIFYLMSCSSWGIAFAEIPTMEEALKDFQTLKLELDKLLGAHKINCISSEETTKDKCQIVNFCELYREQLNSPYLIEESSGRKIVNESFFQEANVLVSCLKDTYKDELDVKIAEMRSEKEKQHLQKVYDLNRQLKSLLTKKNEAKNYALINQELILLSLKDKLNSDSSEDGLRVKLNKAMARAKLKLSNEVIDLLVKIDQEVNNPIYEKASIDFERQLFSEFRPDDLFYQLEKFFDEDSVKNGEELVKNQQEYIKKTEEAYALFLEAKSNLIKYLNEKRNSINQNEIDRGVQRVKLVKFKVPVLSDELIEECKFPNADYSPSTNTIDICPQWLNLPSINLFHTFAHELAHSIDPCILSAPFKIKSNTADDIQIGHFEVPLQMETLNSSVALIGKLDSKGLKDSDQKILKSSLNPFKNTISCLASENSIGAIIPKRKEIQEKLNQNILTLKTIREDTNNDEMISILNFSQKNFINYFDAYSNCNLEIPDGLSQMQESFADKIASELIAKKIKSMSVDEAKKETKKLIIETLANKSSPCKKGLIASKMREKGVGMGCKKYFDNMDETIKMEASLKFAYGLQTKEHPLEERRIQRILLAHPEIRKILGCTKSKGDAKYCED